MNLDINFLWNLDDGMLTMNLMIARGIIPRCGDETCAGSHGKYVQYTHEDFNGRGIVCTDSLS